jgi:predicted MFS family arabinose efflux permease
MVVEEILEIFSTLADRRYINCLVDRGNVSHAQACIEVRTHTVVLAGRPVGLFLFSLGPIFPFITDAASFVISMASILSIKSKIVAFRSTPVQPPRRRFRDDVSDGFRWLRGDKYALITAALMAGTTLIAQALVMIFLAEAHAKQLSAFAIGVVLAASGVGGALGSVCARWLSPSARSLWLQIQMCAWCLALALLAISGERSFYWIAAAMAILGFTGAIGNIEFGTYLVENAGGRMLARVTSIGQMLAIGAAALGPVIGGTAMQRWGSHGAVLLLLFLVVVMAIISLGRPGTGEALAVWILGPFEWRFPADVVVAGGLPGVAEALPSPRRQRDDHLRREPARLAVSLA